ncbi:hypothetical protein NIES267_07320 [Calothrix parasitica NIES-267]|uniref:N-acetyltransferase domain-containing protein n=1 Tax=Calothrix parasitica NIES-267 TaxID=1973488 RepID=A0A1Z4LJ41_9CYAN|nr:hypothetical protein NIES267_07320 [Calothrix parasitica NIES-267]
MQVNIRQSKPEDLESLLQLQADSLRTLSLYNSNQIESLIRSQKIPKFQSHETIFVAEYENKIVGFTYFLIFLEFRLNGIFVHPDFMRRGIGTKLLNAIEQVAIERKCRVINVMASLSSVDFYKANGYQVIRTSGFHSEFSTWIECVNLEKRLDELTEIEKCCEWFKENFLSFLNF